MRPMHITSFISLLNISWQSRCVVSINNHLSKTNVSKPPTLDICYQGEIISLLRGLVRGC